MTKIPVCPMCGARCNPYVGHDEPMTEYELPGEWHGPELDQAMNAEVDRSSGALIPGVCETALHARSMAHRDLQMKELTDPVSKQEAFEMLRATGIESPSEDEVFLLQLRGALGGSFTFGLQVGLILAGIEKESLSNGG